MLRFPTEGDRRAGAPARPGRVPFGRRARGRPSRVPDVRPGTESARPRWVGCALEVHAATDVSCAPEVRVPARRLLDTTELFVALPTDVVDSLALAAVEREYPKGALLFEQGDPSHELFVVLEGRIAIATRSSDGRESLVAVLEAGGLFGELGLFDGQPRSAAGRMLADTRLVALEYDDVRRVLEARPELLWIIVRILAERLRATDEALADAVFLDVPARTAKRILELAGDADELHLPMTQEDLAGLVGASRERVNKALSLFVRVGWIESVGRAHYRILDREALTLRSHP